MIIEALIAYSVRRTFGLVIILMVVLSLAFGAGYIAGVRSDRTESAQKSP